MADSMRIFRGEQRWVIDTDSIFWISKYVVSGCCPSMPTQLDNPIGRLALDLSHRSCSWNCLLDLTPTLAIDSQVGTHIIDGHAFLVTLHLIYSILDWLQRVKSLCCRKKYSVAVIAIWVFERKTHDFMGVLVVARQSAYGPVASPH